MLPPRFFFGVLNDPLYVLVGIVGQERRIVAKMGEVMLGIWFERKHRLLIRWTIAVFVNEGLRAILLQASLLFRDFSAKVVLLEAPLLRELVAGGTSRQSMLGCGN